MDTGQTFSIGFRTCNAQLNTGGEWLEYKEAYKEKAPAHNGIASGGPMETSRHKRNPKHWQNSTRNITILPDGNLVKIHLRLVRRFNNKVVI